MFALGKVRFRDLVTCLISIALWRSLYMVDLPLLLVERRTIPRAPRVFLCLVGGVPHTSAPAFALDTCARAERKRNYKSVVGGAPVTGQASENLLCTKS